MANSLRDGTCPHVGLQGEGMTLEIVMIVGIGISALNVILAAVQKNLAATLGWFAATMFALAGWAGI